MYDEYFVFSWIGAAIGAGTALLSARSSRSASDTSHRRATAESQLNRDFQERMSNTAYQRAVEDMRAAGINPMLAYQQGGASTPAGSMASPPPYENPVEAGTRGGERAMHSAMMAAQSRNVQQQTQVAKQEERIKSAEADKQEVIKSGYQMALPYIQKFLSDPGSVLSSARDVVANALPNWRPDISVDDLTTRATETARSLSDLPNRAMRYVEDAGRRHGEAARSKLRQQNDRLSRYLQSRRRAR